MFFAEAGECIIEYQKKEDHLENLFAATLGVAPEKAMRVFAVFRGLEAKLEAVTQALPDADAQTIARWSELKKRVSQAAKSRNQIAHSTPVSITWTQQLLRDETSRNVTLFGAMIAFWLHLRGEPVPAHLQGL
jgi:hypothetical protein